MKPSPQASPPPARSAGAWIVGIGVVVALVATFVFFLEDTAEDPHALPPRGGAPAQPSSAEPVEIPDPDTREMLSLAAATIRDARAAVVRAPSSPTAWGNFGEACDAHKLYDPAAVAYRRAHELAPTDFRWVYLLAVVEDFRGHDATEIVSLFERAIELNDRFPPLFLRYGDALVRQGELDRARRAYETAVELDPDFSMAHRGLGQVLLAAGEPEAARDALETAARIDPEDGVVFASLAQVYTRLGDDDRAAEAREKARELPRVLGVPDPLRFAVERKAGTPGAARKRVQDALAEGSFQAALPDARFLVEVEPDDVQNRIFLGRCLAETGDVLGAGAHFERAVELAPDHEQALPLYAGWLDAVGRFEEAVTRWTRAVELAENDPTRGARIARLALAQAKAGRLDEALASFARAAELGQDDAELHHNWGTTLMARDAAESARHLQRALELDADNAGTLYNLGLVLEALGRPEEAARAFARSAELDPAGPAAQRAAQRATGTSGG